MASPASDVTQLLREWSKGNESAVEELTPLVYRELRRLADSYMRRERPDHTLQPTALIHEAYLRLVDQKQPEWQSRSHFFRFAAHLMRQILVDHARARQAEKRGGEGERVPLEEAEVCGNERPADLTALDEALTRLAAFDERKVQIIELKYFGGMNEDEIAQALGISVRTLGRDLRLAKAWLAQILTSPPDGRSTRPIPPE
jgi:RNA polymerase sigma factor (TIGR02999 family)